MSAHYPLQEAKRIAAHLVEKYPTHGFIIDREEAQAETLPGETYGLGLKLTPPSGKMEEIFENMQPYLDSLSVMGRLIEVTI